MLLASDTGVRAGWPLRSARTPPGVVRHLGNRYSMFDGLVICAMLIIGGLSYFPALAMGPIAEHFWLHP